MAGWGVDEWGLALGIALAPTGLVGLWYAIRADKNSKIAVYIERWSAIVADITADVSGLEVRYKGSSDLKNLVRVTGYIRNDGNVDIDKQDVHSPLVLKLSPGGRWLEVNCFSERAKADAQATENEACFRWDMLGRSEKIRFEALLELPTGTLHSASFSDLLGIDARIKNTKVALDHGFYDIPQPIFTPTSWFVPVFLIIFSGFFSFTSVREVSYVAAFDADGVKLGPVVLDGADQVCVAKKDWRTFDGYRCEYVPISVTSDRYTLKTVREPNGFKEPMWIMLSLGLFAALAKFGLDVYLAVRHSRRRFDKVRWFAWRT